MAAIPRVYVTGGTISVANGDAFFTGTGTLFGAHDLEGATLWVYGAIGARTMVGHVAAIDPRYPVGLYAHTGPVPLVQAWTGTSIVDEANYVLELSPAIVASATVSAVLARFVAHLENNAGLTYDSADLVYPTDYAQLENNALIVNATNRTISRWRNGVLELVKVIGDQWAPRGPWVGDPVAKTALTISTNAVAVDYSAGTAAPDGSVHFALTMDDDFELQLPTNVAVDDTFDILITASGGPHTPTFAAGYAGLAGSAIRTDDGAATRVRFTVTAETSGTATAVTAAAVTFDENDLVEHGGAVFVSNADLNGFEPQFDGGNDPVSDANWTWVPLPTTAAVLADLGLTSITVSENEPSGDPGAGAHVWLQVPSS